MTPTPDDAVPARRGARLARQVGPQHVGERVSIRHLVDDPGQGRVPTDVVGRLVLHDGSVLMVVDRHRQLHAVAAEAVLGSRVVPPHPRLPPEPMVGSRAEPLERDAARVLLLDPDDRVLLVAHVPEEGARVWTAPGGGLRPGEDHAQAARRELREELGVDVDLGPWVWFRDVTFPYRGLWLRQRERWFLARGQVDAARAPLDDVGTDEARWWPLGELRTTTEELAPSRLAALVDLLLDEGPPDAPIDAGW